MCRIATTVRTPSGTSVQPDASSCLPLRIIVFVGTVHCTRVDKKPISCSLRGVMQEKERTERMWGSSSRAHSLSIVYRL